MKKLLPILLILLLSSSCAQFVESINPNVHDPLGAALVTSDTMSKWYKGFYEELFRMNSDPYLDKDIKSFLRNKVNPKADHLKHFLIQFNAYLDSVQTSGATVDEAVINAKIKTLNVLKQLLIEYLIEIEARKIKKE